MGLVKGLREADDPDDEAEVYGILAALFLVLPSAVRKLDPAAVLKANGYCFVSALGLMTLDDLEQLGMPRGHARMIMNCVFETRAPPTSNTPAELRILLLRLRQSQSSLQTVSRKYSIWRADGTCVEGVHPHVCGGAACHWCANASA